MGQHLPYRLSPRLLHATRVAMAAQALAMIACIGLASPSYLDQLVRPDICSDCFDFRGSSFVLWTVFLTPPTVVLLVATWLLRRPRKWLALLPLLVDLGLLGTAAYAGLVAAFGPPTSQVDAPPFLVGVLQVLLVVIPAVVSLVLALILLSRRLRPAGELPL